MDLIPLLVLLIAAVIIVVVLFVALDYFAGAIGGSSRLWLALKGLIVLLALVVVLQRAGVV